LPLASPRDASCLVLGGTTTSPGSFLSAGRALGLLRLHDVYLGP